MAARIDRDKVIAMDRTGFTRTEIARRLGCSLKQISRILGPAEKRPPVVDETHLREFYMKFENNTSVAARFGISRQAINQMKGTV